MNPNLALSFCVVFILTSLILETRNSQLHIPGLWLASVWIIFISIKPIEFWLYGADDFSNAFAVEDGSPTERLIFSILIVFGVYKLFRRNIRWSALIKCNLWPAILLLYCFFSICWSDFPFVALKRFVKLVGGFIIILLIVAESDPTIAMKRVIKQCGYILIPLSVVLIKYYPHLGIGYSDWTGEVAEYAGVGNNKNCLGYICLTTGLFFLWDIINNWPNNPRWEEKLELFMDLAVLCMIGWLWQILNSKTSLVCFLLGTFIIILFRFVKFRVIKVLGIICIAAVLLLQNVTDISGTMLDFLGRDKTLTDRTLVWDDLLKLTSNPLLGEGFGSFWLGKRLDFLWKKYWWRPNQAHNGYLEVYINLGWVGLLLIISVILSAYRRVSRIAETGVNESSILFSLVVITVLFNMTEGTFLRQHLIWIVFLFTAVRPVGETEKLDPTFAQNAQDLNITQLSYSQGAPRRVKMVATQQQFTRQL